MLPTPPAERLALIIDGLCAAIAVRGAVGLLTAALQCLLWGRLRRAALRVRRFAVRIAAGQPLAAARRRAPRPPRPGRAPPPRLPRGYCWLIRLVPAAAAGASQLRALLTDPEMAALAQAPPLRRLLQPLCQMLGVSPPEGPKRQTASQTVAPAPSATRQNAPAIHPSDPSAPPPLAAPMAA